MLDQLSERLQGVLSGVRSRGALSDDDIDATLREIRLALLEADVNFKVVKDFTAALRERLAGTSSRARSTPARRWSRRSTTSSPS
jgi:signal recognition particle subunit SRP54